ncbi:GNAT family N-acetyltransferase [Nocardioides sp. TRM66260-LWL]|uniref:GNAT family N-acetyltransferase n=1 Tax=Nocardioides sp. TRM66260-LWL TaxID=2874478 RepID=UPI001CC3A51B|nr:GNAT family N-acetyltransferase [Nocardioides sp. TRM66260-LWL]MBZ5733186.1 GNAT family N-acetyltransferase [Nocardioides sp. TRM66260-LWL]
MTLDAARVHAAAAAWTHVPDDAVEVATPEYRLVSHPAWSGAGVQLVWLGPLRRTVRQVIDEVREIALGWGVAEMTWWARSGHPAEFERDVLLRGGAAVDRVRVLAADPLDALRALLAAGVPDDVEVRTVDSRAELRAATDVGAEAFGTEPLDEDELTDALRADAEMPEASWFLARRRGVAVGSAGATRDGAVVRLWGAAVRPDARGAGVHRALLAHRLAEATSVGLDLALIRTRSDDVRAADRAGFVEHGVETAYRLPLR